ncbi:Uncharacterized protein TCAP_02320 [Tolypocladium capitatum]|uniref:Transporter n=1 Tax=Tolypocladium capitatum TaxID=45235 RepID=A0A2K3QJN3_9HYPO|nr:Uncharacterized protein TCAP_02320 [Tolypocladium capitatum]
MSTDEKPGDASLCPRRDGDSKHDPALEQSTPVDAEAERRLVRKQDLRIIPLSAAIYFLCFLDRANIGNAKILNKSTRDDMQASTRSNMLLKKLPPSRWLAFLMLCWGAMTMCLGGAQSFAGVTALRFLLGMFEAGLFLGLVYCLTFWYKHDERSFARSSWPCRTGSTPGACTRLGPLLVGGVGFIVSASLPPTAYAARCDGLILATAGSFACVPSPLGWPTSNVVSTAATGLPIAINVSIGGGLGQIPGVWIYKSSNEAARGYPTGH